LWHLSWMSWFGLLQTHNTFNEIVINNLKNCIRLHAFLLKNKFKCNHNFVFEKKLLCMYNFDFDGFKHYRQGPIAQKQWKSLWMHKITFGFSLTPPFTSKWKCSNTFFKITKCLLSPLSSPFSNCSSFYITSYKSKFK